MSVQALLTPFAVKGVEFRNRFISTAHAPGYGEAGVPGTRYQLYHEEKAKGGIALTMFGGSSIVAPEVSPIYNQIDVSTDAIIPHFKSFATRIHRHGTKLICQISHMGRRSAGDDGDWIAPIAPSAIRDPAHHAVPRVMEMEDIDRIVTSYGTAARRCAEGGLDGVEIMVPSHLPGQFLSPSANTRDDDYGGSLDNRMRFLRRVLEAVREQTPNGFLVSLRLAIDESAEGGPNAAECLTVAQTLYAADLYDLLNLNGIAGSTTWGISRVVGGMAMPLGIYLTEIKTFRDAVGAPVIHAGRIADFSTAAHAIASGSVDLVGMTRAHMADPHIVRKLMAGESERIRPCVGASYCIDRIYAGRQAFCLHNPATGRETSMPQTIARAVGPKRRIVVVGGGPAGLEAARVAAARGHYVVLLEAADRLGGQLLLASKAAWRRDLIGIVDWLAAEVERLGVVVRTNTFAETSDILAENPDIAVIATGGTPQTLPISGADRALSTWDVLSGAVPSGRSVLIYDEEGGHAAVSVAQHLGQLGKQIMLVTNDRLPGRSLGGSSYPIYLAALADAKAITLTDRRLQAIAPEGNRLRAELRHEFSHGSESLLIDAVITECGTTPADALFHALKTQSRNRGVTDVDALKAGSAQPWFTDDRDGFLLFRVGDAVASRDVHAAMLDSLRLMKDV